MTDRALTPTEGARYLLEREPGTTAEGARATYRATIFTPDATYAGTATLVDDGTVEAAVAGAPAELVATLEMFARLTARGAAKRRDDGQPPWPARVLRWRGPGRGQ